MNKTTNIININFIKLMKSLFSLRLLKKCYLLRFDDIKEQLENVETREEAEVIFKDAIVELDKYGLLGGLSVRQAQRLVTGGNQYPRFMNILKKLNNRNHGTLDLNINAYCLIAGRTTETHFIGLLLKIAWSIYLMVPQFLWHAYYNGIITPLLTLSIYQPFFIGTDIIIDNGLGWVWTLGLFGMQTWNGIIVGTEPSSEPNTAVSRFRGIKILLDSDSSNNFYFGFAMAASMQEVE